MIRHLMCVAWFRQHDWAVDFRTNTTTCVRCGRIEPFESYFGIFDERYKPQR